MMLPDHIDRLIMRYSTGAITADELALLESWLIESPDHITYVTQFMLIEQGLVMYGRESRAATILAASGADAEEGEGHSISPWDSQCLLTQLEWLDAHSPLHPVDRTQEVIGQALEAKRRHRHHRKPSRLQMALDAWLPGPRLGLGVAAILILAVGLLVLFADRTPKGTQQPPVAAQPNLDDQAATTAPDSRPAYVATLLEADGGFLWAGDQQQLAPNSRVMPGPITLRSGVARLLMDSGAVVLVKGPAWIDLHSAWSVKLSEGAMVAQVPPQARGFQVTGEGFEVIDLGTEFAVQVSDTGVQCQVVLGEVVFSALGDDPSINAKRTLRENAAVSLDAATGKLVDIDHAETHDISWALPHASLLNQNLVINGGFEQGDAPAFAVGEKPPTQSIPGWIDEVEAIALNYQQVSGLEQWPDFSRCPIPDDAGDQFMVTIGREGVIYQDIDVAALGSYIDQQLAYADLSAWLGGFSRQDQYAVVWAEFRDQAGRLLDRVALDPVRPEDREFESGFLPRNASVAVPVGARSVRIGIEADAGEPDSVCDGYVDNVRFVLRLERLEDRD